MTTVSGRALNHGVLAAFRLAVALCVTISLVGCVQFTAGGQSVESARRAILAIDGVSTVALSFETPTFEGIKTELALIAVELRPGMRPANPLAFFDFLVETAWAINKRYPKTAVVIAIKANPQVDLYLLSQATDWNKNYHSFPNDIFKLTALSKDLKVQLGAWPGTPPTRSAGVKLVSTPVPAE